MVHPKSLERPQLPEWRVTLQKHFFVRVTVCCASVGETGGTCYLLTQVWVKLGVMDANISSCLFLSTLALSLSLSLSRSVALSLSLSLSLIPCTTHCVMMM